MRNFLLALMLLALACPAAAQERRYAILSLVGDALLIVQREMSTGSRLDRNTRTRVALTTPAIDNAMVLAVDREVTRVAPGAKTVLLAARSPELFAVQSRALDAGDGVERILDALRPVVAKADATHLLLVTKHRSDARLRVHDGAIGAGQIEGVGFYIDPTMPLENREKRERSEGFIAPFAYYMVSLVDLKSGRIVAERRATESQAIGSQASITPWQSMSADEKVRMLTGLMQSGVQRVVPEILKAS